MENFTEQKRPLGLYDPQFEHDACGIGAVVDIKGRKSHQTVSDALSIVERLEHRAALYLPLSTEKPYNTASLSLRTDILNLILKETAAVPQLLRVLNIKAVMFSAAQALTQH